VTLQIRPAEPDDALAVARVHVRSWQVAYRTLLPDEYLDGLRPEERAGRYVFGSLDPLTPATIVASEAGAIRGFATTAPARDADVPDHGELWALYVDLTGGGVASAPRSLRLPARSLPLSAFNRRSCGSWQATHVRRVSTATMDGCRMAGTAPTRCGA